MNLEVKLLLKGQGTKLVKINEKIRDRTSSIFTLSLMKNIYYCSSLNVFNFSPLNCVIDSHVSLFSPDRASCLRSQPFDFGSIRQLGSDAARVQADDDGWRFRWRRGIRPNDDLRDCRLCRSQPASRSLLLDPRLHGRVLWRPAVGQVPLGTPTAPGRLEASPVRTSSLKDMKKRRKTERC